jgi:hypothetical protein
MFAQRASEEILSRYSRSRTRLHVVKKCRTLVLMCEVSTNLNSRQRYDIRSLLILQDIVANIRKRSASFRIQSWSDARVDHSSRILVARW